MTIVRGVAAGVSSWGGRHGDEHGLVDRFLFGRKRADEALMQELQRDVSIVLLDCGVYKDSSGDAAAAAQEVARSLAEGAATPKSIVLLCNHHCRIECGFEFHAVRTDEELFAYLWSDLSGPAFKHVGQLMARRWNG
jgi:hypothetical protein